MSDPQTATPDPAASAEALEVAQQLRAAFPLPEEAVRVQRPRRLWVEVDRAAFSAVFDHLVTKLRFGILCTISGVDLGEDLGFIYHLARDSGLMANLKTRVPKGQEQASVTPWFPGGAIYEYEVEDLFGARITGKPPGPRYPLPDDWPEGDHPLLKDWKPRGSGAASEAAGSEAASGEKGVEPNA